MSDYTDEIQRIFREHCDIAKDALGRKIDEESIHALFQNMSRSIEAGFVVVSRQIEGTTARET